MIYYVNKNPQFNWDHEVHTNTCSRLPEPANRINLWEHTSCKTAVQEEKKYFPQANGCYYCSNACHTQ